MSKTVLVIAAPGCEEAELVLTVDMLRRTEGISVTIAGLHNPEPIVCSRNVKIVPDCSLESVKNNLFDCVVLPGGMAGTEELCKSKLAARIVKRHYDDLRYIAAICAAPLALKEYEIGSYRYVTCHPSVKDALLANSSFQYKDDVVVKDENIITSRGPGTIYYFAIAISEALVGKSKTMQMLKPLGLPSSFTPLLDDSAKEKMGNDWPATNHH